MGTPEEVHVINDQPDLAIVERMLQHDQAESLMGDGLTIRDPACFDLRGTLAAGADTVVDINCVFEGEVVLGNNVHIGSNCTLRDCRIGDNTHIEPNTVIEHAEIGEHCRIGPFARLRPETHIGDKAKIGNFVETKKLSLGTASKINHLSYVGDARVGHDVNIGAGVITCNYNGAHKHVTAIGDNAFIGSNVELVAPVEVGAGATIGAGSTITRSAPDNQLTMSRSQQFTVANWTRPTKDHE